MMNIIVFWGCWILCGCIVSVLIYFTDSDKENRRILYRSNLYILFMVTFWPVIALLFLKLILNAILGKRRLDDK